MMAEAAHDRLDEPMIGRLAEDIAKKSMKGIATRYLGFTAAKVSNIEDNTMDAEDFNRTVLRTWAYKNPNNQKQVISEFIVLSDS